MPLPRLRYATMLARFFTERYALFEVAVAGGLLTPMPPD